jgi:predicted membrane GTPase involved in stress response
MSARFLLSTNIAICISPRALILNVPAVSVSLTWSETLPRVSRIRRSRTFHAEQMRREGYEVMVGENARPEDLPVNPCKAKHLTNMRSQGEGKGIQLEAPLCMSLERAIEYIDIDEYVEATPKSLRLRKRILDATARKRAAAAAA